MTQLKPIALALPCLVVLCACAEQVPVKPAPRSLAELSELSDDEIRELGLDPTDWVFIKQLPDTAVAALTESDSIALLSLDPGDGIPAKDGSGFNGWKVLGEVEVSGQTRDRIVAAFQKGIADHDGNFALCFEPRHGIRARHNGATHEFAICFHCQQLYWYVDGEPEGEFITTQSPKPTFNQTLTSAKVPLAED